VERKGIFKWGNRDIAAIENGIGAGIGVQATARVEAAEGGLTGRSGTNGTGSKASAW